jgi:hypothetical protein
MIIIAGALMKSDSTPAPNQNPSPNAAKLSSIKTELLVAFVFSLLALIAWIIIIAALGLVILVSVGTSPPGYGTSPPGYHTSNTAITVSLVIGVIGFILILASILIVRRINKMRHAANNGDVATLKKLNSVGWAILALLFNGVIAGVLLLIANGAINNLQ